MAMLLATALWSAMPAAAQSFGGRDIFEARAVPVDVTAGNVTEAREQGLVNGRVAAFWKIIERLVSPEDLERVPPPSAAEIITMVRDFSISRERSSAVRYLADLTVRFHPGPVQALLRGAGIPFTETVSRPLVVVPLFRERAGARLLLWEETNPWRTAWEEPAADNGLIPFILPLGDIDDLATLSAEQAMTGNADALGALSTRYDGSGTLVAVAEASSGPAPADSRAGQGKGLDAAPAAPRNPDSGLAAATDPGEVVSVLMTLTVRHRDLPTEQQVLSYTGKPGERMEDMLIGAAHAAAAAAQNAWKAVNRIDFDSTTQITALVPLTSINRWVRVKTRLEAVPLVERLNLQAMTRDRAQVTVVYVGDLNQFNLALAQSNLSLVQRGGVWVIEGAAEDAASGVAASPASSGAALPPPPSASTPAAPAQ